MEIPAAGTMLGSISAERFGKAGTEEIRQAVAQVEAAVEELGDRVVNELREIVSERLGRCRCALNHTPLVAALVKGETPSWDWSEFGFPKVMTLVTEARLRYRGEECRLWVLEPRQWPLAETETPAKVLLAMQTALEEVLGSHGFLLREECNVWPIQAWGTSFAMLELYELIVMERHDLPRWRRFLHWTMILTPAWEKSSFFAVVEDHFGPDHAFFFHWACFYIQQLWLLAFICLLALICGVAAPSGTPGEDGSRAGWEVFKAIVCVWTMSLPITSHFFVQRPGEQTVSSEVCSPRVLEQDVQAAASPATLPSGARGEATPASTRRRRRRRFIRRENQMSPETMKRTWNVAKVFIDSSEVLDDDHNPNETWKEFACRWAQVVLCLAAIWLFFLFLKHVFMAFVCFVMYIYYYWAGCGDVDPPCTSPDGPNNRIAPWGTIVEICCDIVLAILFEIFTPTAHALGNWFSRLGNHKYWETRQFAAEAVTLVLASLERVSFLLILATVFSPQWDPYDEQSLTSQTLYDCFQANDVLQMLAGDNAPFACIRQHLPYKDRLHFFTRLVKGPFMVAPFVGILVKIIVPMLAERFEMCSRRLNCLGRCCAVLRGLCRILSFIFVFDGAAVGGLSFVLKGWPYAGVAVVDPQEARALETEEGFAGSPCSAAASSPAARSVRSARSRRAREALDVCDPVLMSAHPFRTLGRCCCRRRHHAPEEEATEHAAHAMRERDSAGAASPSSHASPACEDVASWVSEAAHTTARRLELVLQQGARKPFEPASELLQLKMNLVFVSFFVAVMPFGTIGVFVTLAAKLLEVKAILSKMVFVRRRVFPGPARSMAATHRAFVAALAAAIPSWTLILSLITYHEGLYDWSQDLWTGKPKYIVYRLCITWLIFCALAFVSSSGHMLSKRRMLFLGVLLPCMYFAMNAEDQVGVLQSS